MGNENVRVSDLRTLVVGCTPLARKVVSLLDEISDLVGVVNLKPSLGSTKSNYDCMAEFYKKNPYNVFWTEDINDNKTNKWISRKKPDIIIQCGWSQIFKKDLLSLPKKYCIGIHPSPLPVGRGAAVINWKIIESNQEPVAWGNSLFIMEEKTDTGAVLDFEPFTIEQRDDVRTAYLKVDNTALTMLERTVPKIAKNTETIIQQNKSKATRYYKRTPEDGKMSLKWPIRKICDFVRALTHPYPGAFLETKYGKIIIWQLSPLYTFNPGSAVGEILWINKWKGVTIAIGQDIEQTVGKRSRTKTIIGHRAIQVQRISDPDGNEMWADEWAQKNGLKAGDNIIND